jgi:hypothetical protein
MWKYQTSFFSDWFSEYGYGVLVVEKKTHMQCTQQWWDIGGFRTADGERNSKSGLQETYFSSSLGRRMEVESGDKKGHFVRKKQIKNSAILFCNYFLPICYNFFRWNFWQTEPPNQILIPTLNALHSIITSLFLILWLSVKKYKSGE